jgi:hypothetical protein
MRSFFRDVDSALSRAAKDGSIVPTAGMAVLRCLTGKTFSDMITQKFEDCSQLKSTPEMAIVNHAAGGEARMR